MAFKSLTDDQSDDNFYVRSNFHLPKSSVGLHINAKTEVYEQSPREAEVKLSMCLSCSRSMFAKMMNFPMNRTKFCY